MQGATSQQTRPSIDDGEILNVFGDFKLGPRQLDAFDRAGIEQVKNERGMSRVAALRAVKSPLISSISSSTGEFTDCDISWLEQSDGCR